MKRYLMLLIVAGIISMMVTPGFAAPGSITLDSAVESGGDYSYGINHFFEAGTYNISVVSGAWNPWFNSTGVTGCDSGGANCATGWMWSMDIYQPSTSTYFRLGSKIDRYETPAMALGAHGSDSFSLNVATDENLWFFVKDGNPGDGGKYVWDNYGLVTANVSRTAGMSQSPPVVPEPVSTILFLTGGATLGARGWIRKKRQVC